MGASLWDVLVIVKRLVIGRETHRRRLGVRMEAHVKEREFVGGGRLLDIKSRDVKMV
jgi:hypothetical protein